MHSLELYFLDAASDELRSVGFERLTDFGDGKAFARKATEGDLEYQLFLNLPRYSSHFVIEPSLGVFHAEASRLMALFLGIPSSRTASIGSSLDDLVRKSTGVSHHRQVSDSSLAFTEAKILGRDVASYGEIYFSRFHTLGDVAQELLAQPRSILEDEHLAIAQALTGNADSATDSLRSIAGTLRNQPPMMATQTRTFLASFRDYFGLSLDDLDPL